MSNVYSITPIILAAGEGKRMYLKVPKVLHKVCGIPMVKHVINCAREISDVACCSDRHGAEQVRKEITGVRFVEQERQLGTGHAVIQAEKYIMTAIYSILYGDTPLLKPETIKEMHRHREEGCKVTILTSDGNPQVTGRIVRTGRSL